MRLLKLAVIGLAIVSSKAWPALCNPIDLTFRPLSFQSRLKISRECLQPRFLGGLVSFNLQHSDLFGHWEDHYFQLFGTSYNFNGKDDCFLYIIVSFDFFECC
ncbi:hypothetical protein GOP47_0007870 [Adiantum capillus-veneris]|uniref:Secreted protein n=1 Tax=Adiantum capillus-veneris TaxID=13818 RepID=A0A9D4V1J1_ADICA|nr:hypothetical protein GOP47_0007870 [Adiantum capillus-veneris]